MDLKGKEYFDQTRRQWLTEADSWPSADELKATVQKALTDHGLLILRSKAFSEGNEFKTKLKNYLSEMGTLLNQSPEVCGLFEVKNEGFNPTHPKFRGPSSSRRLTFHTDRCDVIVFYCVRPAENGGINQFVKATTVYEVLKLEEPELLKALEENFTYKRHNADPGNPNSTYKLPVFDKADDTLSITLMTYLIKKADQDPELPNLSKLQRQALDKLQEICSRPELQLEIKLEAGDLLFLNNVTMLHSRTAFEDIHNKRLYYRIWMSVPWSHRLPDSFKVLFGNTEPGAIRGGFKLL